MTMRWRSSWYAWSAISDAGSGAGEELVAIVGCADHKRRATTDSHGLPGRGGCPAAGSPDISHGWRAPRCSRAAGSGSTRCTPRGSATADLVRHTPVLTSAQPRRASAAARSCSRPRTSSAPARSSCAARSPSSARRGEGAGGRRRRQRRQPRAVARLRRPRPRARAARSSCPPARRVAKVAAVRGFGGIVRLGGDSVDACVALARDRAAETGAAFVHPFDDPHVIAGQAHARPRAARGRRPTSPRSSSRSAAAG